MTTPADLDWGAFHEDAPWVLDRDELAWLADAETARARARRQVPELITPARLPPGRRGLTTVARLGGAVVPWVWRKRRGKVSGDASIAELSRRLRLAAEALGPTFIKLGQIISSGEGLFPPELVDEFKRCRDQVPAETWEDVRTTVEDDLGAPIETLFASFEHTPIAAASIAQVHAARLHTGEVVVVKVQRPAVARLVHADLRAMAWLAPHLVGRIPVAALANPPALVELFADTIVEELDFRIEAANMLDIARVLHDLDHTGYVVPRPHPTLVTRRVLVMQRLEGFRFDQVEDMHAAGVDTEQVVRTAMMALFEGATLDGVFHGDLHGGNLLVMADGRTALLDFGIVARMDDQRRRAFLRLMVAATTNDLRSQVTALQELGALDPDADPAEVITGLGLADAPVDPTTLSGDQLVAEMQRVIKALLGYGARMPKELMLYVKNLVFIDGAIARLAPDLDVLAEIASISTRFALRHGARVGQELGLDALAPVDMTSVKASFGLDADAPGLSHREMQARRATIQQRLRTSGPRRPR
ncbi:MAG: ABC1 kinase family protein [Desertimonas sp.]